jgi:hypothetical protein
MCKHRHTVVIDDTVVCMDCDHERKMNKSYAFTGRSMKFWLGIFDFITSTKEDGIENFCKTEYGTDWQWAYSHYQKNKSFPSPFKQAA